MPPYALNMIGHAVPASPHQPQIADNVGGEDCGEAAAGGHCSGSPALRIPSRMGSSWARYVGSSLLAARAARAWERR